MGESSENLVEKIKSLASYNYKEQAKDLFDEAMECYPLMNFYL